MASGKSKGLIAGLVAATVAAGTAVGAWVKTRKHKKSAKPKTKKGKSPKTNG